MKHMPILAQEPYEAPAILDISLFTAPVVHGDSGSTHDEEPEEDDAG